MVLIASILPVLICLIGAIVLFSNSKNQISKKYLAFLFFISFVNYLTHVAYFNHLYKLFAFLDNIWIFTSLSVYPLFYYYIRLLTQDEKIDWKWAKILYPAAFLSLFSFVLYFSMNSAELEAYIKGVMYHQEEYATDCNKIIKLQSLKNNLFKIIFIIQTPIYAVWASHMLSNFDRRMKDFYSTIEYKSMCKARWMLYAFVFASIISIISSSIGKDFFIDKPNLLMIPSITHSLFLLIIIIVATYQNFTIIDYNQDLALSLSQQETISHKLQIPDGLDSKSIEHLLKSKMAFTNQNLRITDVAKMLGTNRTYISRIINEDMGTNFCDLVNKHRVEYAKELMDNPENTHLTLQEIAEYAGFASISSFYRIFNNSEKKSPGKYREEKI